MRTLWEDRLGLMGSFVLKEKKGEMLKVTGFHISTFPGLRKQECGRVI